MDVYLGTVQAFAFNYAPAGWAVCNGALLTVNQNPALFALLSNTFGGNGTQNFGLPNLGGRTVVGVGQSSGTSNYAWGQNGGGENVTLSTNNLPAHNHSLMGLKDNSANVPPNGAVLAIPTGTDGDGNPVTVTVYAPAPSSPTALTPLAPASIGSTGSGAAFSVLHPYLALNMCIALQGTYPSRP